MMIPFAATSDIEEIEPAVRSTYAEATRGGDNPSRTNENGNNNNRKERTFTFYNLMTAEDITESIIDKLSTTLKASPTDLFEKDQRDTRHRSKYYVTFKKIEQKAEDRDRWRHHKWGKHQRQKGQGGASELPDLFRGYT